MGELVLKSFSGIRPAPVRACIAALIGLFVGQCMAAEPSPLHSTARVKERSQPVPSTPPPGPPKVSWPDNGIAQRKLEGGFNYNMFVENDNGTWRAWVQSDMSDSKPRTRTRAKALDFFSGKQQLVEASVDEETKQQEPGFADAKGNVHGPQDRSFRFNRGGEIAGLRDGGEFSLEGSRCSVKYLGGILGGTMRDWTFEPSWNRIPLIYDKTYAEREGPCKGGTYFSGINSTLDLNDGTFLVTMQCWVFRLRKSDLLPAGEASALRIVDEAAMKVAIDSAKGQHIEDARTYLSQALSLKFDDADACMPMLKR